MDGHVVWVSAGVTCPQGLAYIYLPDFRTGAMRKNMLNARTLALTFQVNIGMMLNKLFDLSVYWFLHLYHGEVSRIGCFNFFFSLSFMITKVMDSTTESLENTHKSINKIIKIPLLREKPLFIFWCVLLSLGIVY